MADNASPRQFLEIDPVRSPFDFSAESSKDAGTSQANEVQMPKNKPDFTPLPPSSALSRVMAFLPQMERANNELQEKIDQEGVEAVDVEEVEDGKPFVEMDIMPLFDVEQRENAEVEEEEVAKRTAEFLGQTEEAGGVGSDEREDKLLAVVGAGVGSDVDNVTATSPKGGQRKKKLIEQLPD